MLCVPAEAPDGTSRGTAQGTNPHEHKTKREVCTKRASTPHQEHASARGDTINTGREGCHYRVRVLGSAAVLI